MRWRQWGPALLVLASGAVPAGAADLARIERVIHKEPAYQGQPKYCLTVFGREARLRVWLVHDGNTLYVDKNGNGDLTDPGEAVAKVNNTLSTGDLSDGRTPYGSLTLYTVGNSAYRLMLRGTQAGGSLPFWQYAGCGNNRLVFTDRPQDAPILHFCRPMTMQLYEPPTLRPGAVNAFNIMVGTPGLGQGTFVSINCRSLPPGVRPTGQMEFPPLDPELPPVRATYDLGGN